MNFRTLVIKIYLWRFLSIITSFLSVFIVIPHLTQNKELYGIYTLCLSFTLYLSYADIGFLSAGQKFAAEEFSKGNRQEEIQILGFTGFILLLMVLPFSITMIFFSFYPNFIIKNLENENIASQLFLIIGLLSPLQLILQRIAQSVLVIRIKDYISLRIDIIFNIIKILSVFIFFPKGHYYIVEYFIFNIIMTLLSSIIVIILIQKNENYNFLYLLKQIKFNRFYFTKTKKLAFTSLFLTLSWIIYYELDLIAIGKLFGVNQVAIYAIAFTFLGFLRNITNIIFSPFSQRFNHLVLSTNKYDIVKLLEQLIYYTLPLFAITITTLFVCAKYFILNWVGDKYLNSVPIFQSLIIGSLFSFVIVPVSYYLISATKYKILNLISITLPVFFLINLLIFVPIYKLIGFSVAKSTTIFLEFIISIIATYSIINYKKIFFNWFFPILILTIFTFKYLPLFLNFYFISSNKDTMNFIYLIISITIYIFLNLIIAYSSQKNVRNIFYKKFKLIFYK